MNITLSVSDDVVERVRHIAHEQGTSLNALVRRYLVHIAGKGTNRGDVAEQFDALWRQRSGHSGGWRFDREELYSDRVESDRST
jgi:hypothetical protein